MVDQRIVKFIKRHHVMTLASVSAGQPYCCNVFYAYDTQRNRLIFTSGHETRHVAEFVAHPAVAASIVLETRVVGKVQGLQLVGEVVGADDSDKIQYIKRFPYTALADLTLWAVEMSYMKYTDNTLGFGKKLIWNRE